MKPATLLVALILGATSVGCVAADVSSNRFGKSSEPQLGQRSQGIAPAHAQRLRRIMLPLLRAMDRPLQPNEVKLGIVADREINAANAGSGRFYVTTALLEQASDEQLRGVMAHEIAHEDLGHVAQLQMLGTGLNLGIVLLEQLLPGSRAVTPIAGSLIAKGFSRSEELAAGRHGVDLLRRAGFSKEVMIHALVWVSRSSSANDGGFLSTHPATSERIAALTTQRY